MEAFGYNFQIDNGNHIFTALSFLPPENYSSIELLTFLYKNGVKASSMWSAALGISEYSQKTWNVNPADSPVTLSLSKQILQLPVNRFQNKNQTQKVIESCIKFVS